MLCWPALGEVGSDGACRVAAIVMDAVPVATPPGTEGSVIGAVPVAPPVAGCAVMVLRRAFGPFWDGGITSLIVLRIPPEVAMTAGAFENWPFRRFSRNPFLRSTRCRNRLIARCFAARRACKEASW